MRPRLHPARKGYMATSTASLHLVPSQNLTVAQVFLRYLALEGVDKVFGIPGGGIANLLVEFKNQRDRFTYIVCRHETGAAYIADGYYRATGKLGVVMVTTGPGATNALTGAMNAQAGGSAMLTITGEVAEQFFGKGYLQEGADLGLDISAIYKAATAYSVELTDQSDVQVLIEQALRDALSIPRNATHLSVPNNVPTQVIPSISIPTSPSQYRATPDGVSRDRVREALQQLLTAKRPLIFLGSGCREVLQDPATIQALTHFAERYAIPIMTTPDGKGIFPETHDLSLRVYGCASCLWPAMWMQPAEEPAYDALLVLGTGLRGLSTNNWNPILVPTGSFIQVDLDQNAIARAFPITLGVVGEVGAFIREAHALSKEIPPVEADVQSRRKILAAIKQHSPFYSPSQYASNSAPIEPAALVRVLQETLPPESTIMLDAGNCVGWGLHYFVVDAPMQIHSALAMGPMGFAVGAVIGAKMGCPDRTCVGLVGDGAFMMHGSEVSTAATYNVGAIWVVLQDDDLHMVTQGMTYLYPDAKDPDVWDHLYQLGTPDLVKFSEGLGADAYLIEDPAQLTALMPTILDRANKHNKPQVVVARINRTALDPFFPPKPPVPKPPVTK
jgi:acetolactate synthase I/II/III large subunit